MNQITIFDIGKTNKKCLVFDEHYQVVFEKSTSLPETLDEDGFPCEDLNLLTQWVKETIESLLKNHNLNIRAINCTTYGASFVHLDAKGNPLTPLYNYLKPFPNELKKQFFDQYGNEENIAIETASPVLGMLNSGLQLYWLKYCKPLIFKEICWSLHLPQFIALNISMNVERLQNLSKVEIPDVKIALPIDMTSLGCHTMLWDFQKKEYHQWVKNEGIVDKLTRTHATSHQINQLTNQPINQIGNGLHDSSAALIPYLATFQGPFVLISTGTWCISLNPFNNEPLTDAELKKDCLCYMTLDGKPVKAARYFGGNEHDEMVKKLALKFNVEEDFYKTRFRNLKGFRNVDAPEIIKYLDFMRKLIKKQVKSTKLALGKSKIKRIFVDGGFSKNEIYMQLLTEAFPKMEIFAAEVAQASALGAALIMHEYWNKNPIPNNLIATKKKHRNE
jgi:sugar (pentulose or hexulose) kinase